MSSSSKFIPRNMILFVLFSFKSLCFVRRAMSTCVAEAATALVEPAATGVTGQDDAYTIFAVEKYYTKCFDNDKKSVKGIEECVKVDKLIQKEATKIGGSKKPMVSSDSYQSIIKFSSEPTKWVEEKKMDPWFEDSMSSKHMYKWQIENKDERSVHAKMSIESLADPKMEEQNIQSVTVPVLPSPKKQDVSNLSSRKVISISTPTIKAYVAQKGEAEKYEYKSKGIRVKRYCTCDTNKEK